MTEYRDESQNWVDLSITRGDPYAQVVYSRGMRLMSAVADDQLCVQQEICDHGYGVWRVVNESNRIRTIRGTSELRNGRGMWDAQDPRVQEGVVHFTESIPRTDPKAARYAEAQWEVEFRITRSGPEAIRTSVGQCFADSRFLGKVSGCERAADLAGGTIREGTLDRAVAPLVCIIDNNARIAIDDYSVVDDYVRFEDSAHSYLTDEKVKIISACKGTGKHFENFLVWGHSGEGKTSFITAVVRAAGVQYDVIDLSNRQDVPDAAALVARLEKAKSSQEPYVCIVDEVDKRLSDDWVCGVLLSYLGANAEKTDAASPNKVFVLIGSTLPDIAALKNAIASKTMGGNDLVTRIRCEVSVPQLTDGDRMLIALSQIRRCAAACSRRIRRIEKFALFYALVSDRCRTGRGMTELVSRAVEMLPAGEERLRYAGLFDPTDSAEEYGFLTDNKGVYDQFLGKYTLFE